MNWLRLEIFCDFISCLSHIALYRTVLSCACTYSPIYVYNARTRTSQGQKRYNENAAIIFMKNVFHHLFSFLSLYCKIILNFRSSENSCKKIKKKKFLKVLNFYCLTQEQKKKLFGILSGC